MSTDTDTEHNLTLRNLSIEDYDDVRDISARVYRSIDTPYTKDEITAQVNAFPDGQICIEDNGTVVAAAFTLIIDSSDYSDSHTYREVVGEGLMENHDPEGDYLYGIEIFVNPDYQGMRLGRRLYDARKQLCENLNLKGILVGGRIPGYSKHEDELTPRQYIDKVRAKELYDPVLTFQISNDFHVRKLLQGYWPLDHKSGGHAVLLEWVNISFQEHEKLIGGRKPTVRLGIVQWQMRRFASVDDVMQQAEFFVDTVSSYQGDLVLFPELFNAPLIAQFEGQRPHEAMRSLAGHTEAIVEAMVNLALSHNINIVAGSMPELDGGELYNTAWLCRRDGTLEAQRKIHITPEEFDSWGFTGGHDIAVFETDIGKVGILVCFDVEFPELARFQIDQGMEFLLVPFWTDTKNGYLRVRRCAQARAIENECYVALSGSIGNIPKVETMGIQYARSAVFTPSDFAFPHDAIAAEAAPSTETTLIVDLDMKLLRKLRKKGSVQNLQRRRRDLYELKWCRR